MTNLKEVIWPSAPFDLVEHAILIGLRGSQSHGLYIPNTDPNSIDDIDILAIAIPPKRFYFGLTKWEAVTEINDPWDVLAYEFKKFVGLLTKQNPNVQMMLWLEEADYLYRHSLGNVLISCRDMFASKDSASTFIGYANGQRNKMTHIAGEGYLGDKRKQLVAKYGYDTKNAAHTVRLLNMGIEYLETGKLQVKRTTDRQLLIDIKTGKYPLSQVIEIIDESMLKIKEAELNSPLPPTINMNQINDLCVGILEAWFVMKDADI